MTVIIIIKIHWHNIYQGLPCFCLPTHFTDHKWSPLKKFSVFHFITNKVRFMSKHVLLQFLHVFRRDMLGWKHTQHSLLQVGHRVIYTLSLQETVQSPERSLSKINSSLCIENINRWTLDIILLVNVFS